MSGRHEDLFTAGPIRMRRYIGALVALWTVAIAIVLAWELADEYNQAIAVARSEALGAWKKEAAIYHWAAMIGSIYVPISDRVQPDPNLAGLPDRDITTPAGKKLTLISPPSIVERLQHAEQQSLRFEGRLCSLQPLNSANKPDAWESSALASFAYGQDEATTKEWRNGSRYLRLMRPLILEPSCMPCHAKQGYKVGDICGGLSVTVPIPSIWGTQMVDVVHRIMAYGVMWLLGLLGIAFLSRHLNHQIRKRQEAEENLRAAHDLLEQRVAERTAELATANDGLQREVAERRQAEQWLLESEQRFRGYFEQGLVGMAILSAAKEWVEVNPRLCQMLGYTEDELFLKPWDDITHPDDRAAEEAQFRQLLEGVMKRFVLDKRLLRRDATVVDVRLSAQCMRKHDGAVDCVLVLVQELGAHKAG